MGARVTSRLKVTSHGLFAALPGYAILSIVLSSVVVVLAVASFFIFRYVNRQLEIAIPFS